MVSVKLLEDNGIKLHRVENGATLLSTYAMAGNIIASITNLSIGKIANISINLGFIACGIFSGIAFIMVFVFFRKSLQTN